MHWTQLGKLWTGSRIFGFSVRVGLQSETCHQRLVNACQKPPSVRKFDHVKALGCLASKVSLLGKLPSDVLAGPWCCSSIAGRHTNVEPRLQCTRSKRSRMITTAVALLGLIGFFYSLPAVATWVKVALCGTLGLAHILSQVMSWTVQDGNISTAFVLQFLLTFVCLKLRIQNLVYPWLLSTGSSWAGTNQAFGWVMDVPEAKRKQICALVPEVSAAFKKGLKLPELVTGWAELRDLKVLEYRIGSPDSGDSHTVPRDPTA